MTPSSECEASAYERAGKGIEKPCELGMLPMFDEAIQIEIEGDSYVPVAEFYRRINAHHALLAQAIERAERAEKIQIEKLAEGFHDAWMRWASTLMLNEPLSARRISRWKGLMVPYAELSEEMKEYDRKEARRALESSKGGP